MNETVVLLKTHVWNADLEKFALKIFNETNPNGIDFFILMHTDTGELLDQIQSETLRNITIKFSEEEIKRTYSVGFYSMWLSNHWILMWFYKQHKYRYYWSVEYDVRISGDSSKIWKYQSPLDFLYTLGNYRNTKHVFSSYYIGGKLASINKFYGFLQIARYSARALDYLDQCYTDGENGQDELITFSLLNRGNFTGSKSPLKDMIRGIWTGQNTYTEENRKLYEELEKTPHNKVYILHPIK